MTEQEENNTIDEKKIYLKNKNLLAELEKSRKQDRITEELGEMFMLLSERNVNHRHFVRYPFREDLISVGVMACCKAWKSFNPEKAEYPNPFAFFTTCIRHALIQYVKNEYKNSNAKNALKVDAGLDPDYGYQQLLEDENKKDKESDSHLVEDEENETEKRED